MASVLTQHGSVTLPLVVSQQQTAQPNISIDGRLNNLDGAQLLAHFFHTNLQRLLNDIHEYDIVLTMAQARTLFDLLFANKVFNPQGYPLVESSENGTDHNLRFLGNTQIKFRVV